MLANILQVFINPYDGRLQIAATLGELFPFSRADEQNCIILVVEALVLLFILPDFADHLSKVCWDDLDRGGLDDLHLLVLGLAEEPVRVGIGRRGTEEESDERWTGKYFYDEQF